LTYKPEKPLIIIPLDRKGFLIAASDPINDKYQSSFDYIDELNDDSGLQIDLVPQSILKNMTTSMCDLIRSVQHRPVTLVKLLTNIKLSMVNNDGSKMHPKEIKYNMEAPIFQLWLHKVYHQSPCFIFFLKDKTMRFHAMAGEFSIADRTRKTYTVRGLAGYKFLQEKKDEIEKDFQDAALAFIDYCKVAGIDPKPCMERVYKEMLHTNDYEMMLGIYNEKKALGKGIENLLPIIPSIRMNDHKTQKMILSNLLDSDTNKVKTLE
jgi:hypothetical protein